VETTRPIPIPLGFVTTYLIPVDSGCVLVDAGVPGQEERIFAAMAGHGYTPESLRMIIVTHAHGDHVGSLEAVAERSHAPVLAHRTEAPAIESGQTLHPQGLTPAGRVFARLIGAFVRQASGRPCHVDVMVDEELSLAEYGIRGRAIHTPGHTSGSISVLLDSGDAIVGDLCARMPLIGGRSHLPFFGESKDAVYSSWRRLLDAGGTRFLPAHGSPIAASALRADLAGAEQA
jgi:hydroxyacylglutathione hydrolase